MQSSPSLSDDSLERHSAKQCRDLSCMQQISVHTYGTSEEVPKCNSIDKVSIAQSCTCVEADSMSVQAVPFLLEDRLKERGAHYHKVRAACAQILVLSTTL